MLSALADLQYSDSLKGCENGRNCHCVGSKGIGTSVVEKYVADGVRYGEYVDHSMVRAES